MITQTPKTYGMYIQAEPDSSKFLLAISMAKWAFWVSLVGLVFTVLPFFQCYIYHLLTVFGVTLFKFLFFFSTITEFETGMLPADHAIEVETD